jgi:hypothetical protein
MEVYRELGGVCTWKDASRILTTLREETAL